jgi:hypothetical protein
MRIEKNFNKTSAKLIDVPPSNIITGSALALGVKVSFQAADGTSLSIHMSPSEAANFGRSLSAAAVDAAADNPEEWPIVDASFDGENEDSRRSGEV